MVFPLFVYKLERMTRHSLAIHLLGVLLWVMALHAGPFHAPEPPSTSIFADFDKPALFYPNAIDDSQPQVKIRITEKDLNKSVSFARDVVDHMQRLETNLGWANIRVELGSPSHGQLIDSEPEVEALRQGRHALVAAKATIHLMNTYCNRFSLSAQECVKLISKYNLISSPLHSACPNPRNACSYEQLTSKYRSLDGSCNNKNDGLRGKSYTSYTRLLPAHYMDGVQEMRRSVNRKFNLPSPRLVSTNICRHRDIVDNKLTLAVMQWSQFVEHDLAHTAANKMVHSDNTIECCDSDGSALKPRYVHPFCAPIAVPGDDSFYSKYSVECMPYVRSVAAMRSDCSLGPLEQINQATHYLDGSQIYGSDIGKISQLRKFRRGLLQVSKRANKEFLPVTAKTTYHCQYNTPGSTCFISGDSRVNAQPQLTAMHILWHREHNRIAVELAVLNPHWDDETLYQEARRIVIAEMQHITYNEWLPVMLGSQYVSKIHLSDVYSEQADPAVTNSFATAALRVINSLIDDKLGLYSENRVVNKSLNLREYFNRPSTVGEPGHLDALIRGLATQQSQKLDMDYASDITSQLFRSGQYGFDVLSLDIQRGRDHGLPRYTAFRQLCGLPDVEDFSDLSDVMTLQRLESLKSVYRSPHDVDLLVGGMSENPDDDSLLGPTFSCLIADQMLRSKRGDRYFYTNRMQPKPFLTEQLAEIKEATLARVFCDNGDDILSMQANVFKKISESNILVSCLSPDIPYMNLELWAEPYQ